MIFIFIQTKSKTMKRLKLFTTIGFVTIAIFTNSCNSGDQSKTDVTTGDTSTVKTTPSTSPKTSAPANIMSLKFKVANYSKWKSSYDGHDSIRLVHGLHKYIIARGIEDSNTLIVAMKMDDINKAKEMAGSQELKDRMKKSGVIETPTINYLETVMNDTSSIEQRTRLLIRHKVKDFDTWKKTFDSTKQDRVNAGLTDRVLGYAVSDNHDVSIILAVADVDKAKAFINSKDLKDKMKVAGVDGLPTFFFYRIVEMY